MIDPTDHLPPDAPPRSRRAWTALAMKSLLAITASVGVWYATRRWLADRPAEDAPNLVAPLLMMALVLGAFAWQEWRWYRPRRRLMHLIAQIRGGRMPIESLKDVRGGIATIAGEMTGLLHHSRKLERQLAEMDAEMTQRVQNRTDALQRVIGSLRLQAIRDPLTQLFNRRALDELLPRLIDHCRAGGEDLSLFMIDVDFFKQLNDQLGHAAGDEMLRSIAQIIRSSLGRSKDVAFRCGGDEFVIVLPGCPPLPAQQLADRLKSLVATLSRTMKVAPRPALSIGLCSLSELPSPTPAELLREADRRLYEAKQRIHGKSDAA